MFRFSLNLFTLVSFLASWTFAAQVAILMAGYALGASISTLEVSALCGGTLIFGFFTYVGDDMLTDPS